MEKGLLDCPDFPLAWFVDIVEKKVECFIMSLRPEVQGAVEPELDKKAKEEGLHPHKSKMPHKIILRTRFDSIATGRAM
ncbi:hypothetical protein SDJN03_28577, partial [Cucurbita argyrosperma subsp. sororia]